MHLSDVYQFVGCYIISVVVKLALQLVASEIFLKFRKGNFILRTSKLFKYLGLRCKLFYFQAKVSCELSK